MCDDCREASQTVRVFTRRAMLALTSGALGAAAMGLWSCRRQPPAPPPPHPDEDEGGPATTSQRAPAPDLGDEVFPDAAGHAIASPTDAPVIIVPRADWTPSRPNLNEIVVMNGISRLTVHHTAGEQTNAWDATVDTLQGIRNFHSGTQPDERHWADIAYHFVIDGAGRAWQARPLAYQGAHVRGHNEHNLGIVLMGNFDKQFPAAAQLIALAGLIAFVRQLYRIPMAEVHTHGELGKTNCPGKNLQAFMDRARKTWALNEPAFTFTRPATTPSTAPATTQ